MADKTININKNGNDCNFTDSNGAAVASVTIDQNGGVVVDIGTGFGTGAQITGLTLYNDVGGQKGSENKGSWSSANPNTQPVTAIRVTKNGNGIKIADTNNSDGEIDYFFCVTGSDSNGNFASDPELKVRKITST